MDTGGGGLYVYDQFKLRLHSNVGKLVYFGVHYWEESIHSLLGTVVLVVLITQPI